jgi:glycosyltransferase involved in cell wall biosynthesis
MMREAALTKNVPRVCFPFVGRDLGGSHVSALPLMRGLDATRYEACVLLQYLEGPIFEFFRDNGIEAFQAPKTPALVRGGPVGLLRFFALTAVSPRLARRLKEDAIDIVHCNDGRTSATWALAAKLAGAKLVWHNRGNPNALGLRFAAPLLADKVVSVSRFASPRPGPFSAAAKNDVVFSPFDTAVREDRSAARGALLSELDADPATTFIGYFGALVERKRPLLFVDAIAELRTLAPNRKIVGVMFGSPRDREDEAVRTRIAERGVAENVKLMGFRAPGSYWIAACDILLAPAVGEPLGRTLVEAMLVGTPVVAADSGGNPEAIRHGETGWLAPPEDAAALAGVVLQALDAPDAAARIARKACADARARFGEQRHIDAIMQIYDRLLGAPADPGA